ncbi:MAG: TonB-dependent receptor [Acidobacteria bacterium]|nr:TonB-dependent receptor [Acidobacteriota bacterium]
MTNTRLLPALSLLLALAFPALSQNVRGLVTGLVTDAQSKPLAGVQIELLQQQTGKRRTALTTSSGEFTFSALAPGAYRLEAARDGFRKHADSFSLLVNQELRADIAMTPGTRTDTVEVSATRDLLKTETTALGAVVDNRQVRGLPLDGRNFYELTLLVPGALPSAQGSAGSVRGDFAVNLNGQREDSNLFLLDGVYNSDPKLNGTSVNPPVDAIQEFEVLTSSYDASFGRNAGGQINVVTKSGGNDVHGTLYEFFRNGAMDSANYFAPKNEPKPAYHRNQFGFSLGGPIIRNKTFFFTDYEGRRANEGITRLTRVPTLAERSGDFSSFPGFLINPYARQPFPGNRIPRELQHPIGQAIANLYPQPNRTDPVLNYVSSPSQRDRGDHFDARLDHLFRKSELTFRYSFADRDLFEPFAGPAFAAVPSYGNNVPRRAQNVMLSETRTISSTLLNEVRLAFNRVAAGATPELYSNNVNSAIGIPMLSTNPRDNGLSFLTITGYSPLGHEYNSPLYGVTNTYQFIDQASWSHGRHLLKFGGDIRVLQQNAFRDVQARGFIQFRGALTQNPLGDVLMGLPTFTGAARLDNPQHLRGRSYNAFINDTFRIRPNITLTLGLRYEFNQPPVDSQDRANLYDPATGQLVKVGSNGIPRGGYFADKNNFGPRLGFAWSLAPQTVLRAGYGIYYDQSALAPSEGLYFNAPYFDFRYYFPGEQTGLIFVNNPFPANYPIPTPPSGFSFQRDLRTPYIQQWNLNIQQQIGKGRVLEVGYVGSRGTRLYSARDINQPAPSPSPLNLRPNYFFSDINQLESRGNSNYHSLQTRFQQRFSHGLSMIASYTMGKSIDDASAFFPSAGDPNFPQDSRNVRAERARSNFDIAQRFSAGYSYSLPFGKGRLRGGWQTHGIVNLQTGRPFTVALPTEQDNSNTGITSLGFGANDRPNLTGNPRLDKPTADRWFNTQAFALPAFGSFGNAGRNILEGPGNATVNFSIVKDTAFTERLTMQLRLETFNLFNRANFDLPDLFYGNPTFGRVQSAQNPRRTQLGIKFLF